MKLKAYAKLNLYLCVKQKKGKLHKIESIFQNIDLFDVIEISEKNGEIEYIGPNFRNNTIIKILNILGIKNGLKINLKKNIPTQAGFGGGSSDAAAVLIGLDYLLKLHLKENELLEISSKIGSDVPFFIKGGTCLIKDTGNNIEKLDNLPEIEIVVLKPGYNISTVEAYKKLDENLVECKGNLKKLYDSLKNRNFDQLKKFSFNSFDILFSDERWLKESKSKLSKIGGINPMLTGSGSGIFAYLPNDIKISVKPPVVKTNFIKKGYEIYA